jgi:hypothetical protein
MARDDEDTEGESELSESGETEDGETYYDDASARNRRFVIVASAIVLAALVALGLTLLLSGTTTGTTTGPEGVALQNVPDLAPAGTSSPGTPVDGITCRTASNQSVRYHIHVHVDIFVDGAEERLPAGVGIPLPQIHEHFANGLFIDNGIGGCLYWLHVHTTDGVIHVEAPHKATFTLGQFFDIWQQPLTGNQVGPAKGRVTAFENGRRIVGDPRRIPLLAHATIQLDVGSPVVSFQPVEFEVSGVCGAGTTSCAATG